MKPGLLVSVVLLLAIGANAQSQEFSYEEVAKRYADTQLSAKSVRDAEMQGECLVGLKELNFVKRSGFDPVAEWTNFRAISLLEQFPPCTVLIIIEVARKELIEQETD